MIAPSLIEPLFQPEQFDKTALWRVLEHPEVAACLIRATSAIAKSYGMNQQDREDMQQDVQYRVMLKLMNGQGYSRPLDWAQRTNAGPWLCTLFRSRASEFARTWQRRMRKEPSEEPTGRGPSRADIPVFPDETASDADRQREQIRLALRTVAMNPSHRLALLLTYSLEEVTLAHLDNAKASLKRPPHEALRLLTPWRQQHLGDHTTDEAQNHLAWVLLSADETDPQGWIARNKEEATKARNLLSKWLQRASAKLRPILGSAE